MAEQIGTVVEAGYRPTKDGSKDYFCMVVDKFRYGLFDPELKHMAEANLHKRVKVVYSTDEKGRKVEVIEPLADAQQNGNGMTKEVWTYKDRMITRTAVAKSMIEYGYSPGDDTKQHFDWWVALIYGEAPKPPQLPVPPNGETKPADETKEADHKPSDAPIEGPNDLIKRVQAYFPGKGTKDISKFVGVSATEWGKWSPEKLTEEWIAMVTAWDREES